MPFAIWWIMDRAGHVLRLHSHSDVPRLALATTICRLREASRLFDACALGTDQGIAFELGTSPLYLLSQVLLMSMGRADRQMRSGH